MQQALKQLMEKSRHRRAILIGAALCLYSYLYFFHRELFFREWTTWFAVLIGFVGALIYSEVMYKKWQKNSD